MTLAFDTLAYARKLQEAGFTEAQASAQAEALSAVVADNLATKTDIAELRRDIKELETALRREIAAMSDKLTIRLGGRLVVGIAGLAAITKFL